MIQVLLVEDDIEIARTIRYYLAMEERYETVWVQNVEEAIERAYGAFDAILLDVMLPDGDGVSLCTKLRELHGCPIIFISCLDDSETIVSALGQGGDDYIVKPFDNRVLHARIEANLRRAAMANEQPSNVTQEHAGFILNPTTQSLSFQNAEMQLPPIEYRLLSYLMLHHGRYFKSSELYRMLWGKDSYGDTRTVIVHMYNLRKKIEKNPANPVHLINVRGKGYSFV